VDITEDDFSEFFKFVQVLSLFVRSSAGRVYLIKTAFHIKERLFPQELGISIYKPTLNLGMMNLPGLFSVDAQTGGV